MYFVDQNDEIITKAKYEFSSVPKQNKGRNLKYAHVNQNQNYIASYWKQTENILFWKNKKKINKIRMKREINSIVLENQQNIKFIRQITFNNQKQIIFKNSETVQIFDFIRKSLTICDRCYTSNRYEYCPINDIILIPQGGKFTEYISVWSLEQNQIIREIFTGSLKEFRIKMAKSGKYFIVSEYRRSGLDIYSYGDQIKCVRRIENVKPYKQIEWVLDDNYLLIHSYSMYQILQIDNGEIIDCKIQKMHGVQNNPIKYNLVMNQQKKEIYILIIIQGNLAHYVSIQF